MGFPNLSRTLTDFFHCSKPRIVEVSRKVASEPLTQRLSLSETVAVALWHLGGDQHPIDTEDVAKKVNELAPGAFTWRKYPDQINLELVRVNLSDAKLKAKLVTGGGRHGWSLTPHGVAIAREKAHLTEGAPERTRAERRSGSIDEVRWRRERDRVLATTAWTAWHDDPTSVSTRQASDVFRIDTYAVGRIRDLKVNRLLELFDDDLELKPFLKAMAARIAAEEDTQ